MKSIKYLEHCICGTMPVIHTHNCLGFVEYGCKCPNCGRGCETTIPTSKTPYQAMKKWNELVDKMKIWESIQNIYCN